MNNAVRKTIYAAVVAMLMLLGSGCIIVPYGYETVSQEVIGVRADSNGNVYEQIVHYDKRLNFFVIGFPPDAKFVGYFSNLFIAASNIPTPIDKNSTGNNSESGDNEIFREITASDGFCGSTRQVVRVPGGKLRTISRILSIRHDVALPFERKKS